MLSFVACAVFNVNAQKTKQDEGIKLGIKGGLNVTNLFGDVEDTEIRTSVNIGLLSEIIISDKFSLQPELLYSGQGATYKGTDSGRIKLDYITLPVLAKFPLINKLSLTAGPQVGFLVSSKFKTNTSNDKIADTKPFDFSLNAGLEYQLKNGLFFQGRYNLGLTNVGYWGQNNRANNSAIQFSVGVFF